MRHWIFGIDIVTLLTITLAGREMLECKRLRECCEEHVKWWEESLPGTEVNK